MFLFLAINMFFSATINLISPTQDEISNGVYFTSNDIEASCANKGITLTWNTAVANLISHILVISSEKGENTPICFRYGGTYYGTTCGGSCTGSSVDYPSYPNGQTVEIFVPYYGMADFSETVSSITLSFGVDCSSSTCTSANNNLNDSSDDNVTTVTLYLDDTAPNGFTEDFDIVRSNKSIYIKTFNKENLEDTGSGVDKIRFYYALCGEAITKGEDNYKEFSYNSSLPWKLDGLDNGVSYTLAATVLDGVGNEYPSAADEFLFLDGLTDQAIPINIEDNSSCATPTQVLGFVDNDEKCFIATEIFGKNSSEVLFYRWFRNTYLLKNDFGKLLVKTYYDAGPSLVKNIRKHPVLKFGLFYYLKFIYKVFND